MAFWNDPKNLEPTRAYRFLVSIPGGEVNGVKTNGIANFVVKKISKPGYEISESEHKFLNHSFFFPGKITWNEVTLTIVDALEPDGENIMMELLDRSGYKVPVPSASINGFETQTISKAKSVAALGDVIIRQLDGHGFDVKAWTLHNPWIKSVNFGELDYESEELMNIEITIRYDFAHQESFQRTSFPTNQPGTGDALINPPPAD